MLKKLIVGNMQTNCYVLYNDSKEAIVVDPGANGQKISKYLDENELSLLAVLITHGHFDHIGAVDYLYNKYQCPIYTHKETKDLLLDASLNLSTFYEPFVIDSPVEYIEDVLDIKSFHFDWMLLEGHCQGSSMIYYKQDNLIFSGDVLFKDSIGRFDFPTSSNQQTKNTLRTIKEFDFDARVLPGHGDETTIALEKVNNYYLRKI